MWFFQHFWANLHLRQFSKFCLIGFGNTFLDYGVYLFFSRVVGLYFVWANMLAILIAMISSFIFNKYWTFQNKERRIKVQSLKFVLVNAIYFLLSNAILYLFVQVVGLYDLWAKVIAIIVGLFWNFFANKFWVFAHRK